MQRDTRMVEATKAEWKRGERVVLIEMSDPQAPPAGSAGCVKLVDDLGQIHVAWDLGSSLALVPGVDRFRKLAGDADVCPECGSERIEGSSYREEDRPEVLVREFQCSGCGCKWVETWSLDSCQIAGA